MKNFAHTEIKHVPHKQNTRADVLSKLVSTRKKGGNKSSIQKSLSHPSIENPTALLDVNIIRDNTYWITLVFNHLTKEELPSDQKEASATKRRACSYNLVEQKLYRRGFSIPLLKCIEETKVPHML